MTIARSAAAAVVTVCDCPPEPEGSAAVFSGDVQIAGVFRMAVLRANSWLNYLFLYSLTAVWAYDRF